ncbi:DegT/DnrJ/EryC1/StrS family aminotransferase [Photorhabdus temperata]|uniref:Uncharacterized protein n=1 Tax=Photorhabdus temperata J3 TaxID=1389415 RepID=U7R4B5_PHOTE|nr:DegT/DnrJ/EryC1/StrS family aminotransferase [Photorhabdus temperata]ERT13601.1 hypothetical protein O185_07945 [Photorhabdus temperata J3]
MKYCAEQHVIKMYRPSVVPSALERLRRVFESGWIGLGPVTEEFENELTKPDLIGKNPVLVSSGTAALHLALVASGIPKRTSVIVPANTFIATAAAALYHQCRVLIADIERKTGNIDLNSVRQILELERDVSTIIPVHYTGIPCDLDGLSQLTEQHGITIIEDCAHAMGTIWNGSPLSLSPNVQAYSFHATKTLTVGEGGCVTFPDTESAERARKLRRFGIDKSMRSWGNPYDIPEVGFKYNMSDIMAAIGLAQLDTFSSDVLKRQKIMQQYRERLANTPVELVTERSDTDRLGGFAVPVLVSDRDRIRSELYQAGIETEIYFRPLTHFPINCVGSAPVAEQFAKDVICLPIHPSMDFDSVDYVCDCLIKALR